MVIKNIGKSPAYKINFSIEKKYKDIFQYNFENKISYFAPNQEITIFGKEYQEFEKLECDNIPLSVTYYSKENKYFKEVFKLEWQYLSGTLLGTDNIESIDKNLKNISTELQKLTKIIKEKEYNITSKLKIIEIEKTEMYLKFIFSNGYMDKINIHDIHKLNFSKIEKIYLTNGKLQDYDKNLIYTAEEIYNKLIKLKKNITKQRRGTSNPSKF